MKTKLLSLGLVLSSLLFLSPIAYTSDDSWTNTANGYWDDTFNWSTGVAPSTDFETIWITNVATKTVTIDGYTATRKPATLTISNLTLSASNGTNTLFMNNAGLATPLSVLNSLNMGTNGVLVVNDSAVQVSSNLFLGQYPLHSNSSSMIISNGGAVYSGNGRVGGGSQSKDNIVIVSGNGSTWNNSGDLSIGNGNDDHNNQLIITAGGAVYDNFGTIGMDAPQSGDGSVFVTGTGSTWSNRNNLFIGGGSLTVTNGGMVFSKSSAIDAEGNAVVVITGTGSVWNIQGTLSMNSESGTMTVSAGGFVHSESVTMLGPGPSVLITGTGSVWSIDGDLDISEEYLRILTVADNGVVNVSGTCMIGSDDTLMISGSVLCVTNNLGTALLGIGVGTLSINGGTVTLDQLATTVNSSVVFNGAVLRVKSTTIISNSANSAFVVGDGTDTATFILDSGGSGLHSFANGLTISSNAFLTGCGTINGNMLVDAGGTVLASCGGTMTFSGIVTNNGTMHAINGSVFESYGTLVNNGTINGTLNLRGLFIDHGIVLSASNVVISALTTAGNNVMVQAPSLSNCTYQLQATPSLTTTNWLNIGSAQPGTGSRLSFTDIGGATNRPSRFYRVHIIAP